MKRVYMVVRELASGRLAVGARANHFTEARIFTVESVADVAALLDVYCDVSFGNPGLCDQAHTQTPKAVVR